MSRAEVDEYVSEDLGFRLSTGKQGVPLFSQPVDFEAPSVSENPLQLLHVGHKKGIYAASNTHSFGIGYLADLDDEESVISEKFRALELESVTSIRFDASNEHLYLIAQGLAQKASVDAFLSGAQTTFDELPAKAPISVLEPSPFDPAVYACLDMTNTLYINSHGEEKTVEDVSSFTWTTSPSELVIVSGQDLRFVSLQGTQIAAYSVEDAGELFSVATIDNHNWYVVGKPEDEDEDDIHTLVTKSNEEFVASALMLPPSFNDLARAPVTYFAAISQWLQGSVLAFTASALSSEFATIECGTNTRLVSQSNDTDRAELPMDDDSGDDTLPVGFALDLSGTSRTVKNVSPLIEEAVGILPRLLCLNNMGHLFIWNVFDVAGVRESKLDLNRAIAQLPALTESKVAETKPAVITNAPSASITSNTFAKSLDPVTSSSPQSGFGSSAGLSFGASSFGAAKSTPMFGAGDFKASSKAPEETSATKPAFGASGFGASGFGSLTKPNTETSTMGSIGFGASNNNTNTKPAFGASGFGASGFGASKEPDTKAPAFGSSSFGGSTFGKASTSGTSSGPTSFGNSTNTGSGFGSGTVFGKASFDTQKPEKPFASISANTSQTSASGLSGSGFGANSKFGTPSQGANTNVSPFASLSQTENSTSPFAKLMGSEKQSPFGDSKPMEPVTLSGPNSADKSSPFSALDQNTAGFGASGSTANKSIFSAGSKEISDSDESSGTEVESASEDSDSFDEFPTKDNNSLAAKKGFAQLNLQSSENTGFEKFNPTPTPAAPSKNTKPTLGGLYENLKSSKEPKSHETPTLPPKSADLGFSKALSARGETSSALTQKSEAPSLSPVNPVIAEKKSVDKKLEPTPSKPAIDSKLSEEKPVPVTEKKQKKLYEGDDIAEVVKKVEYLKLGGFSEKPSLPKDEISRTFTELVQLAQGNVDILELNTEKTNTLVDAAGTHRKTLGEEDLANSTVWALGDLDDLKQLATEPREALDEILITVRHQNTKLGELLKRVDDSEEKKEDIEKVITQLALFKQSLDKSKLSKRPLDVRAEMLRHQLRKKVTRVESLQEEIAQKLLPLGVRLDFGQGGVAKVEKLEKIVHELGMKARELSEYVSGLEEEVYNYCESKQKNGNSEDVPLAIGFPAPAETDPFTLAQKFAHGSTPRKIRPVVL